MPNFCIKRNGEILIYDADGAATPLGKIDERGNYLLPEGAQPHLSSIIEEKIREVVRAELEAFETKNGLATNALEAKIRSIVREELESRLKNAVADKVTELSKSESPFNLVKSPKPQPNAATEQHNDSSLNTENGYEWVDLGLPSGLKWATCNIGAIKPDEYGDYFAWGETEPKSDYTQTNYNHGTWRKGWSGYLHFTGSKYITSGTYGNVDNRLKLEPEDDAAAANWGGKWRMPTAEEIDELIKRCEWEWIGYSGVMGYLVKSKANTANLFLPAAGYRLGSDILEVGAGGYYWPASLYSSNPNYAREVHFDSGHYFMNYYYRYCGLTIRPVCP